MATFYVVATPIGNLEDITLRAIRVLKEVDLILCEDTRETRKLLDAYDIKTPTLSYHARSGLSKIEKIFDLLKHGKNLALVTDAGTPGISDPGTVLVGKIRARFMNSIDVVPIPGPAALTAALSASGVPSHEFTYFGFLPHKKGRETLFREISNMKRTAVFYESKHRILKTLKSLEKFCPNKKVCIARELTKIYEEFKTGSPAELLEYLKQNPEKQKGEFVVIVT
ncbi:MAG: 16S rRNA (cytidine(1402)-2'-O)-methyltransferase [Patescibacteria group bacterium]